ncbi:hypothetical protein P3X46_003067 [Hevea brasiliensis]|uniref:CCHC-type domain-containing protein n=1 Tax=Hevea brasiliensis TaxID=3981 RepID=A0ABQ9N5S5_HEVBR|nr:hypothetical protein P3X46_003067 [Hevea brasiliensis]
MLAKDLGNNAFLFQFVHPVDLEHVIKGSPWSFQQNLLVLKQLPQGVNPRHVELMRVEFWIQVHNLPSGFMSERVAKELVNYNGNYVEADPRNFTALWRDYMRIRVCLDINKPLKRRTQIKKPGGEWSWVNFKYERLSMFCYFCGMLGHSDRFCAKLIDHPGIKRDQFAYGSFMKAESLRVTNIGERWLLSESDFLASGRSGGDDAPIPMDSDSPTLSGFVPILKDGNPESLVVSKTGMVQASVHGKELQNSTNDAAGVIVGEPKRRCTKNMELNPAVEEDDGIGSKNLIEAGSDSQARLAQ